MTIKWVSIPWLQQLGKGENVLGKKDDDILELTVRGLSPK